jgi:hypothetical protein
MCKLAIPVDPAGDYHYQDSAKPCEVVGIELAIV